MERDECLLTYDQIFHKTIDNETIDYGLVVGNHKVVFIKTGADGNISGYENKYLKIAHRLHTRLGATVVCASNPYIEQGHVEADKEAILEVVEKLKLSNCEFFFFGTSDGAYHNLSLASELPQTVKLLAVNASMVTVEKLTAKIAALPLVKKVFVYGDKDDEYDCIPTLIKENDDTLEIITVEGADHEFSGMTEKYIALTDLL